MQVGDVVSLRVRTSAGPTEVVGEVLAASPEALTVRRRTGQIVEIRRADVAAGRVVPPAPAQTIGVAELELIMSAGWRALETEQLGDWLLRASAGVTQRGNSLLPLGDPGRSMAAAVTAARRWYADRDLPPRAQVPDAGVDADALAALTADGWTAVPGTLTIVMTAEIVPVLRAAPPGPDVDLRLDETMDDAWFAAWRRDSAPHPVAARELLANHETAVFASVRQGDDCVGIARATVDGRWAGLFAVEVAAAHRRGGLARALSIAALRWAVANGARRAYLQVEAHNAAARALYTTMGFTRHHDYRYLVAPDT